MTNNTLYYDEIETNSPLHEAIIGMNHSELKEVIQNSSQNDLAEWLSQVSFGNTPLLLAAKTAAHEMVSVLSRLQYELGVEVDQRDETGLTAIAWVVFFKHQGMMENLVKSGANIDNDASIGRGRITLEEVVAIPFRRMIYPMLGVERYQIKQNSESMAENCSVSMKGGAKIFVARYVFPYG